MISDLNYTLFYPPSPWINWSKKLKHKIENPYFKGRIDQKEAEERRMRLVLSSPLSFLSGGLERLALYLLVDESDGVIVDLKFEVSGPPVLIGILEVCCELMMHKNYIAAKQLTADVIEKKLRDKPNERAFPKEYNLYLNVALECIEEAAQSCEDITCLQEFTTPLPQDESSEPEGETFFESWKSLDRAGKLELIEAVISKDIRPYIELDAGGIKVVDFINGVELIIAYEGSCTSCHSATGSTLNAIQQVLRSKVSPEIIVTPDLSFLQLETEIGQEETGF